MEMLECSYFYFCMNGRAALGPEQAVMCVRGVDTMKDDPTAIDVLFAKVTLTEIPDRFVAIPLNEWSS